MTTSFTYTATTASAPDTNRWTVDRLSDHFIGEFAQDRNAAGGSVPDRWGKLIREAGQYLWLAWDWRFRLKPGTLTTVAETETAAAASDFAELWQKWLRDPQAAAGAKIMFFEDPALWQRCADFWDPDDRDQDSEPRYAVVCEDTSATNFTWYFKLRPVPDAEYTYPYWYATADPWALGTISDSGAPSWPKTFDRGWYLLAKAELLSAWRTEEDAAKVRIRFERWLRQQKASNDETMSRSLDRTRDVYGDWARTPRHIGLNYTGVAASTWP